MADLPHRKKLPHTPPSWVNPRSFYFITICGVPRGENQFCLPEIGSSMLRSATYYHEAQTWYARMVSLMPDHVHAILCFPPDKGMKSVLRAWKSYQKREHGITWQADFFDHRIRNDEDMTETMDYIRNNPVKAALIEKPEDWPYLWMPESAQ
jgi:putative transposase